MTKAAAQQQRQQNKEVEARQHYQQHDNDLAYTRHTIPFL
jgi:hypothetical protein